MDSGAHWASLGIGTETVRTDLANLDGSSPHDLVRIMVEVESKLPGVLAGAERSLGDAIGLAERALTSDGRLIYVGSGTSGRLAVQDAAECQPTFGIPPQRVLAVMAGGERALVHAVEGAEDNVDAGRLDLERVQPTERDCIVGVSASGRTPYVLAALRTASRSGAATVAIVNNIDTPMAAAADVAVELHTGAEVIAGSTRLSAGTAQKVALNILSTATMIRLGKTLGPWMVDLQPSNRKLRERAIRITAAITEAGPVEAQDVLEAAGWHTATAVLMILTQSDRARVDAALKATAGHVPAALARLTRPGSPAPVVMGRES